MRTIAALSVLSVMLAGCGGSGASVPSQFMGTWGADCSAPYLTFASGTIHVFPDDATYPLKSASQTGNELTVAYDTKAGAASEVYVVEGAALRLDRGTYAGEQATWHKAPMRKCS